MRTLVCTGMLEPSPNSKNMDDGPTPRIRAMVLIRPRQLFYNSQTHHHILPAHPPKETNPSDAMEAGANISTIKYNNRKDLYIYPRVDEAHYENQRRNA